MRSPAAHLVDVISKADIQVCRNNPTQKEGENTDGKPKNEVGAFTRLITKIPNENHAD